MEARIVLFIVEGFSDETSLAPALEKLSNGKTKFKVMRKDIISDFKSNVNNIEKRLIEDGIKVFINKHHGYLITDICKVIQITDTDGCFCNDNIIKPDNTVLRTEYHDDKILQKEKDINLLIKSRINKRNNINHLLNVKYLTIKGNQIPYELYYMSCNLDHVLHNKRNSTTIEKIENSESFSCVYDDPIKFIEFFNNEEINVNGDYVSTWNYIKMDNNSLKRHSNFFLLLHTLNE